MIPRGELGKLKERHLGVVGGGVVQDEEGQEAYCGYGGYGGCLLEQIRLGTTVCIFGVVKFRRQRDSSMGIGQHCLEGARRRS